MKEIRAFFKNVCLAFITTLRVFSLSAAWCLCSPAPTRHGSVSCASGSHGSGETLTPLPLGALADPGRHL